jgi:Thioredoxin
MSRKSPREPLDSPAPGVIPESTHVHGEGPGHLESRAPEPQAPAETDPGRGLRGLFRRKAHNRPPRERPSASHANARLVAADRVWRHKIVSHPNALRPHVDPSHDHLRGPEEAAVTLVEYGDYQSPACIGAAPEVEKLRERYDGELRVAFRHFPVGQTHPFALHAAEAAEAAGAQGRFWDMHDLIYGADHLEPALLRKLAKSLDLDLERFDTELADETHLRHVMEDVQSGVDSGVNGTPTFFINGERHFEMATLEGALEQHAR